MLDTLPPEIFARVLEIAIETWGIGFLPPICLVSSTCYDVVVSTPSLWGIIVVGKQSSIPLLTQQLAKAKATDLRISFLRKGPQNRPSDKHTRRFMDSLTFLTHNWVRVEMPTSLLLLTRWVDMWRVEVLSVRYHATSGIDPTDADKFFESDGVYKQPNLHSFTAEALPEEWVTRFLNPRITFFEISRLVGIPTSTIQRYLSLIPGVHTLHLRSLGFLPFSASNVTVRLSNLTNLELHDIRDITSLLLNTRAPGLRTLSMRNCTGQMGSVFSQWSQPGFLPSNLQSLELSHSLSEKDIPFLIGWLARLPALLRLTISHDDEIADPTSPESSVETDLFKALASPDGAGPVIGGWLCPSLIHLYLDTTLRSVAEILPIARARTAGPGRAKLQTFQAQVCSSGSDEELAIFHSLFEDPSDTRCVCLGCSFNTITI
ncbi:hypothetical protein B0H11DRAFT_1327944 [Mycena galericulata]|nr:hypothetical protein B0H11DRAFT_1327944 [Mycena galericulata]